MTDYECRMWEIRKVLMTNDEGMVIKRQKVDRLLLKTMLR